MILIWSSREESSFDFDEESECENEGEENAKWGWKGAWFGALRLVIGWKRDFLFGGEKGVIHDFGPIATSEHLLTWKDGSVWGQYLTLVVIEGLYLFIVKTSVSV